MEEMTDTEIDGMTDREYVGGVRAYTVVAGECPNAPAGSIVYVFPHVGWSEAGEVVAYAGGDGLDGVTFGRVLDVLFRGGDAVYLISRQDPADPPIEIPDSEVVGEVLSMMTPDEIAEKIADEIDVELSTASPEDAGALLDKAARILWPSQTVGGAVEAGPVRVSRPRRSRRRR